MATDLDRIKPIDCGIRLPPAWKSECCGADMTTYSYTDAGIPHTMEICDRCGMKSGMTEKDA